MAFLSGRHLCPPALLRKVTVRNEDGSAVENAGGVDMELDSASMLFAPESRCILYLE